MATLKKVKEKAWKFYCSWRKVKTYSPALESEIRISLKGWRHLSGATGYKKRSAKDVYRRLTLLPYAKKIIEKSTTIQNVTVKNGTTFYALEAVIPVNKDGKTGLRKVRVILVEDKAKNRIFLSIMDRKASGK